MSKIHEGSDLEEYLPPRNLDEAVELLKSRKVYMAEIFTKANHGHPQRVDFTPSGRLLFLAKAKEEKLNPVDAARKAIFEWMTK